MSPRGKRKSSYGKLHVSKSDARSESGNRASLPPEKTRIRKWTLRLAFCLLIPTVFFLFLEFLFRALGVGYPTGFFLNRTIDGQRVSTDNPQFGWQFFPPSLSRRPFDFVLPLEKPKEAIRVFILGGSAAMGDPDPSFSPSRWIQAELEARYPNRTIEVVNAAMTGINSHVVRTIAEDCVQKDPDFLVLYLGNNEVVGPYGPGTVFSAFSRSLWSIRIAKWLNTLAMVQLLESVKSSLGKGDTDSQEWGGMRMFLENRIHPKDPRLVPMTSHFRKNLEAIIHSASRRGVPVILCTVAVNLKDFPPLSSLYRDCSPAEFQEWYNSYQKGIVLQSEGKHEDALTQFEIANAIDDSYAELPYRMAQSYLELHQLNQAKSYYQKARDCDALRFRTDTALNETIRSVALDNQNRNVTLLDVEQLFSDHSPSGIPGDTLFLDHVHFSPKGTSLIGHAMAESISSQLAESVGAASPSPSFEDVERRLAFTPWDRLRILELMMGRFRRPPFPDQLGHDLRMARLEAAVAPLYGSSRAALLDESTTLYRGALSENPDDWVLHENFARLLQHTEQPEEEVLHWRYVLDRMPHHPERLSSLGQALSRAGQFDEAIRVCQKALDSDSDNITAYNGIGIARMSMKQNDAAIQAFARAIQIRPDALDARNNLAVLYESIGETDRAIAEYGNLLQIAPNETNVRIALVTLLGKQGQWAEAIDLIPPEEKTSQESVDPAFQVALFLEHRGRFQDAESVYQAALKSSPRNAAAAFHLGLVLESQEEFKESRDALKTAIGIQPDYPEALNELSWILSTQPDSTPNEIRESLTLAKEACRLTPNQDPILLDTLATAFARNEQFDDAIRIEKEALRIARDSSMADLVFDLEKRLQLFTQRKPFLYERP